MPVGQEPDERRAVRHTGSNEHRDPVAVLPRDDQPVVDADGQASRGVDADRVPALRTGRVEAQDLLPPGGVQQRGGHVPFGRAALGSGDHRGELGVQSRAEAGEVVDAGDGERVLPGQHVGDGRRRCVPLAHERRGAPDQDEERQEDEGSLHAAPRVGAARVPRRPRALQRRDGSCLA